MMVWLCANLRGSIMYLPPPVIEEACLHSGEWQIFAVGGYGLDSSFLATELNVAYFSFTKFGSGNPDNSTAPFQWDEV